MPRIPTYEPGQVRQGEIPTVSAGVDATAENFGGGRALQDVAALGHGLSAMGGAVEDYRAREQERIDRAMVRDELNRMREAHRPAAADIYSRQGKDAFTAPEDMRKWFDDYGRGAETRLKTGKQKEMFAAMLSQEAQDAQDRAWTHRTREVVAFEKNTRDAENAGFVEDAVAKRYDPEALAKNLHMVQANTVANLQGQPEPVIARAKEDAASAFHKRVLEAQGADNPDNALAYLGGPAKGAFSPDAEKKIREYFQTQKARVEADALENAARDQAIRMVDAGMSEAEMQARVDKDIRDADQAVKVMEFARAKLAVKGRDDATKTHAKTEEWWKAFEKDPRPETIPADAPRAVRAEMLRWAADTAKLGQVEPDRDVFAKINGLPADKLQALARDGAAWSEMRRRLGGGSSPYYKEIEGKFIESTGGKTDDAEAAQNRSIISDKERGENLFRMRLQSAAGITYDSKKHKTRAGQFVLSYEKALNEERVRQGLKKGQDLKAEEKDRVALRLLTYGDYDDAWIFGDTHAFRFEADAAGKTLADLHGEEAPAAVVAPAGEIPEAVKKAGGPDAEIKAVTGGNYAIKTRNGSAVMIVGPDGKVLSERTVSRAGTDRRQKAETDAANDEASDSVRESLAIAQWEREN